MKYYSINQDAYFCCTKENLKTIIDGIAAIYDEIPKTETLTYKCLETIRSKNPTNKEIDSYPIPEDLKAKLYNKNKYAITETQIPKNTFCAIQ